MASTKRPPGKNIPIMKVTAALILLLAPTAEAFQPCCCCKTGVSSSTALFSSTEEKKDNNAMAFLRRKGLVGGNKDFTNVLGIDEGPSGKAAAAKALRKAREAFKSCVESGVIDDFSNDFPLTSSGNEWAGFSDRVMGGVSTGSVVREKLEGKDCNLLTGRVSLFNNGGFIQMATELSLDPETRFVDASEYDGVELDLLCQGDAETETFNVQ